MRVNAEIFAATRIVLQSPVRRRLLLQRPFIVGDLTRFLMQVVPATQRALRRIRERARAIPDPLLRREALASIEMKSYNVAGAAVLATFLPRSSMHAYIEIVVPLESIYDYLDNLCDRHPAIAPEAFPALHQAIADACDPTAALRDYYACGPHGEDGGYLRDLVSDVQNRLRRIDGIDALVPFAREAASLYARMQSTVHGEGERRIQACRRWFDERRGAYPHLRWNEFVAATGSQFQVYAPLFALLADGPERVAPAYHAYFPNIAAIHVLLDSFIDRAEDREHDDLNLVDASDAPEDIVERLAALAADADAALRRLADPRAHRFALRIMTLFYLSHPKIEREGYTAEADAVLERLERSFAVR